MHRLCAQNPLNPHSTESASAHIKKTHAHNNFTISRIKIALTNERIAWTLFASRINVLNEHLSVYRVSSRAGTLSWTNKNRKRLAAVFHKKINDVRTTVTLIAVEEQKPPDVFPWSTTSALRCTRRQQKRRCDDTETFEGNFHNTQLGRRINLMKRRLSFFYCIFVKAAIAKSIV